MEKIKNFGLLALAAFLGSGAALAQEPADLAADPAVVETQQGTYTIEEMPEEALAKTMSQSLAAQGKALGVINEDNSIYVIGAATTARPSNQPGFVQSRNSAYAIAELTAKMNLLRMSGESISSGRSFSLLSDLADGQDPDVSQKASMLEKAEKIADKSLDKALMELGVSESEIMAMNADQKKAAYEQNFNQNVRSLVSGMLKGCAVVRIAEGEVGNDDYQVAVCVKYSPEFHSFAGAIQNGCACRIPTAEAKNSREKILNMPEDELIPRLGVWITYNEEGEMVIYGFGQQEVREVASRQSAAYSRAYSQARLQAIDNIKHFVAEQLVAEETMDDAEKLREYADGTASYFSQNQWEQRVKVKQSEMNLATEQVRQWRTTHPISNTPVAGYVVAWTRANTEQSKLIKEGFVQPAGKSGKRAKSGANAKTPTGRSAILIGGSDEDL